MNLTFKYLGCMHCHSQDLKYCEWVEGDRGEEGENWLFSDSLDDTAGINLKTAQEAKILFRCGRCRRYSMLDLVLREQAELLLPYQHRRRPHLALVMEVNPATQEPTKLHVGPYPIDVLESEFRQSKHRADATHPFYPYPLGIYWLNCRAIEGDKSVIFDCEVERTHLPVFFVVEPPDVEVYTFTVEWTTESGLALFQSLITRRDEQELAAGFPRLNALLSKQDAPPEPFTPRVSEAASIARSGQAYRFIHWLENQARIYVWELYKEIYKPSDAQGKWWKGCFPTRVRENIELALEKARKLGRWQASELPLDYADFDDLMTLIEKEWPNVTAGVNSDLKALQGHFQYVKHFRHDVAHSRKLSHSDLLVLQENARRWSELLGADFMKGCPHPFYPPYSGWTA